MARDVRVYEAAKLRFKHQHTQEKAPPTKPNHNNFWTNPFVVFIVALVIASVSLSAHRTGSVFNFVGGMFEAIMGVIVIEGVVGGVPFFLVVQDYKEKKIVPSGLRNWMMLLALSSTLLGLSANIYDAIDAGAWIGDTWNYIFLIFVGGIATVTVGTTSHMLGVLWVQNLKDFEMDALAYESDLQAWTDDMNETWLKVQSKWCRMIEASASGQTPAIASYSAVSPVKTGYAQASSDTKRTDRQTPQMGYIQTSPRQTNAVDAVIQHLNDNPNDAELSGRKLAGIVGVGKDSAYKALSLWNEDNND